MKYLSPCIPEMRIKDYETYEAFRNGIFSQLYAEYGFFAGLWCRNPDMILLALLSDGLAGRMGTLKNRRNLTDPTRFFHLRTEMSHTQGIRLSAEASVLIAWYGVETQCASAAGWRRIKARIKRRLLRPAHEKAAAASPILERMFLQVRDHAEALSIAGSPDYDFACQPMENLFGALLAGCARDNGATMNALRHMGAAVGRITYLMHAVRSYRRDKECGNYNVFLQNGLDYSAAVESAQRQCNQAAAEIARSYKMMILVFNREIVENIFFHGLEQTVADMEKLGQEAAR